MDHFGIWVEIAVTLAGAAMGWRYGKNLYASGIRVQGHLSFRRIPFLGFLILLFLCINAFFMVAADSTILDSLVLPIIVDYYEAPVRWVANLWVVGFVFATVSGACYRDSKRLARAILLSIAVLFGISQAYGQYMSRPVKLRKPCILNDVVLQTSDSTCAAAAGANVARQFGIMVSEADMVRLMGTNVKGTRDSQIVYGLAKINLKAVRKRFHDRDIRKVKSPALLSVDLMQVPNGHSVAFMGMQGDMVRIWDPASGRQLLTLDDVRDYWRGWAFEVTK